MAKKIVIQFNDIPLSGIGFSYDVFINGLPIVYGNGESQVNVQYVDYGTIGYDTDVFVEIQTTLSATIANTIAWISARYSQSNINYYIVGDNIEVVVNVTDPVIVSFGDLNDNISAFSFTPSTSENINLRYFFQYKNIVNDEYLVQIYKKEFLGTPTEIHGKAILDKGSVKDHLELIRGTGWSLELEANLNVTLEDLYTENEQDLSVKIYKNGSLIFLGYVNPEGLFQSFVRDEWIITLDCVDGLGALSNLSFVDPDGFPFIGKMKGIDIVYNCLLRTGIKLPINVSINTFYDGLDIDDTTDILAKIYLNADRYQKIDNDTIMSCEEVLKSVLDLFCACITQENGEWYIYKPNELYNNSTVVFKTYSISNLYLGLKTKKLKATLGSHIDNFYPHHCNGDQMIQIKGSISKFRINYKYGFVSGILPNPKLIHDGSLNYEGWSVLDDFYLINDPTKASGFILKDGSFAVTAISLKSDNIAVVLDDLLSLKLNYIATLNDGSLGGKFLKMKIQVGTYYLKYTPKNNLSPISDAVDLAEWSIDSNSFYTLNLTGDSTIEVPIPKIPVTGDLTIGIVASVPFLTTGGLLIINELDIKPTSLGENASVGEFHTLERGTKISSNVKEVKTIYNGDNGGVLYLGAIFKQDKVTPTTTWNRKGRFESFPILQIAAEEEMRISQKPLQIFKGSVYGQIPYLSVIEIDNVTGEFMPIEYSYDTMTNISTMKLLELYSAEITDLIYKFTFDYGNVVKPTIKG